GGEGPFVVPERAGEVAPIGAQDGRAAAADELVPLGQRHVVGVARGTLEDTATQDESTRLARDVLHRVVPILRVVRRRREGALDTVLAEGAAGERHQLPP